MNFRIISQSDLVVGSNGKRLKVHANYDVTLPEPIQGNDCNNVLMRWMYAYQRVLKQDPSAQMKMTPFIDEKYIPY